MDKSPCKRSFTVYHKHKIITNTSYVYNVSSSKFQILKNILRLLHGLELFHQAITSPVKKILGKMKIGHPNDIGLDRTGEKEGTLPKTR